MLLDLCKKLEAGTDKNLRHYFTKTATIKEIAHFNNRKVLAVGLKGIGKTATYRFFSEFETDADVTVGITQDKFTLFLPHKNLNYATCRKQFEHDLVIEALRAISSSRDSLKNKVSKVLLDKATRQVKSYVDSLKSLAGRFGGISILGCGFTLTKGDTPVLVGMRKDKEIAESLVVLREICEKGIKIRIVVDDPELVFSASRDLDTQLIGGFCLAALRLSEAIAQLKIIVLLKTHVYFPIAREVEDLSKYPEHMGRLSWSKEELTEVIANRLKWSHEKWEKYFIGNEKQARDLLKSLCLEVRNGPRDLLRWVDLALQSANGAPIDKTIFMNAKKKMAQNSLAEVESAHSGEYPRIPAVIKEIFHTDPFKKYTLKELINHIADLLIKDPEMMALSRLPWMQCENSRTLPKLLFEIAAIAIEYDHRLILPYEEDYDIQHFEAADSIFLAPTLIEAMA